MRRTTHVLPVLLCAFALGACANTPPDSAADTAAIGTLRSNFAAAIETNDPARIVALYTNDAVMMPENTKPVSGHDAILAFYTDMTSQFTLGLILNAEETKVAGDWAFDRGSFMTTLTPKAAGAPQMMEHGKYIVILQKQADGSWRVAREIGNSNDPLAPPPPTPPAKPGAKLAK